MKRLLIVALLALPAAPAAAKTPAKTGATPALVAVPTAAVERATADMPHVPPATPAPIGFVNAADLRDQCLATSPTLASSCFAYITAVHDTVRAYEAWLNLKEYCLPAGTTQSDLRDAFLAYMHRAPEHAFGEAASVVVVALKEAYACPITPAGKR